MWTGPAGNASTGIEGGSRQEGEASRKKRLGQRVSQGLNLRRPQIRIVKPSTGDGICREGIGR